MADTDMAVNEPVEVMEHGNNDSDNTRACKYKLTVIPNIKLIYQWIMEGKTDYSICDQLSVSRETWYKWKKQYVLLSDCYTRACLERNKLVMHSMFRKATTEIVTLNKQKVTSKGEVIDIIEEVYAGADVNAADLYLRNNDPDYKSAKSDSGPTITVNNIQLPDLQLQLQQLNDRAKQLDTLLTVDAEVIE